jgi:hypothetical protein
MAEPWLGWRIQAGQIRRASAEDRREAVQGVGLGIFFALFEVCNRLPAETS